MERWSGRVALVTGASAGIGAAIVRELVKNGLIVVGLARRAELVEELSVELKGAPGKLHAFKGDASKEEDILAAFDWVKKNLGRIDVLVNNAGVLYTTSLTEAFKLMKEKGVDDGHIIHINSVHANNLTDVNDLTQYDASKQAVTVLTEGLRWELVQLGSKIRVTSIKPGCVETNTLRIALHHDEEVFANIAALKGKDIADAVIYTLSTPPHVQVHEITIKPVGEKF
uniref:Uncharacterized protein n=1 Tax=Timema tahoe TaxID=61484 RepID=A0A7R9P0B4_9NEOP|nr:unnamed protein product [Timema tahoe]